MEYEVICKEDLKELVNTVNLYLRAGWVCLGGVSATVSQPKTNVHEYCQAMTHD